MRTTPRWRSSMRRPTRSSTPIRVRHPGHRQLELDPRLLDAAAQGGRRRARHAGRRPRRSSWQVEPQAARAANGQVLAADERPQLSYGDLAEAASSQTPPTDVAAQGPRGLHADRQAAEAPRHAGQDQRQGRVWHRRDAAGMKFATPGALPGVRRQGRQCRRQAAKAVPGVRQVVVLDDLVAVVGDHMWAAKQGLDALDITWDEGPNANVCSKDIWAKLRAASAKDGARREDRRRYR